MQITGQITYNGHTLDEFVPQRTAAYVSQVRSCRHVPAHASTHGLLIQQHKNRPPACAWTACYGTCAQYHGSTYLAAVLDACFCLARWTTTSVR